jgi:phosphoketolase
LRSRDYINVIVAGKRPEWQWLEMEAAVRNSRLPRRGNTTTPFDITVLNGLDRFHRADDAIDRVPLLGDRAGHVQQIVRDMLVKHRRYIEECGRSSAASRGRSGSN